MPVTAVQSAPYAPQGVIIGLLERNRDKGLPNPLTAETLQRLGVTDSLIPRTLQTFKILDLIGEDGKHTDILESLRKAPEAEYQGIMAQWLNAAYAHTLDVLDPATADDVAIRDAFRNYNPVSLQPRMITLFTALFEAAGVRSPDRPKATPKKATTAAAGLRPVRAPQIREVRARASATERQPHNPPPDSLHPALAGMIASLPKPDQGWTKEERDRWYAAFGVILDLAHPSGLSVSAQLLPDQAEGDHAEG